MLRDLWDVPATIRRRVPGSRRLTGKSNAAHHAVARGRSKHRGSASMPRRTALEQTRIATMISGGRWPDGPASPLPEDDGLIGCVIRLLLY